MIFAHRDNAHENRITLRILSYWERLRAGRIMPAAHDIKREDIHDMWDSCFLLHSKDAEFSFAHLGEAIKRAYHGELEEGATNGLVSPHSHKLSEQFMAMLSHKKPMLDEGEFVNLNNRVVKYRQCLVPLGTGDTVEAIFGGMRYKVFEPLK
jgi:hypothetical protein